MPYRICKTFEIENGHMLSKHPDLCRFPHRHSRRIEFMLDSDILDSNDMVCDFKILSEAIKDYLETWDHAICMNTADPNFQSMTSSFGERIVGFQSADPTTEVMAETLYRVLSDRLKDYLNRTDAPYPLRANVRISRVRVWETSSSWAEYLPPS